MNRAGKIARLGEVLCRTEQHRGVAVVTAGMHPPALPRGMGERVLLVDVQRVHIGPERNRATPRRQSVQGSNDAGSSNAALDRDAKRCQPPSYEFGGLVLRERGFRMGVNVMAPLRHHGVKIGDAIDDRHWPATRPLRHR